MNFVIFKISWLKNKPNLLFKIRNLLQQANLEKEEKGKLIDYQIINKNKKIVTKMINRTQMMTIELYLVYIILNLISNRVIKFNKLYKI